MKRLIMMLVLLASVSAWVALTRKEPWPDCKADPKTHDISPESVSGKCLYGDEDINADIFCEPLKGSRKKECLEGLRK